MQPIHFVTGATGFVGSALVLELLRESSFPVICLARSRAGEASAEVRVHRALDRAAAACAARTLSKPDRTRVRVVEGDLCSPLGLSGADSLGQISSGDGSIEFWHVAATLRYERSLEAEIYEHNVAGTQRVLELAKSLGAARFNYMSTAYVAGRAEGRMLEQLRPSSAPVNNAYERSKIRAEHCVAGSGLPYRIFRPSIVIGFSKTGSAAGSDSGFYGYVRRLLRLGRMLERRGRSRAFEATFLPGDPKAPLDMIPVDAVARNAVAISQSASCESIFHLTNAAPPELGVVADILGERLGLGGPRFSLDGAPRGPYARRLAEQMEFFLAYLAGGKSFDRSHTDGAIGAEASLWPLDVEGTRRYLDRFIEELDAPR